MKTLAFALAALSLFPALAFAGEPAGEIWRIEKRSAPDTDDWDFLNDRKFPNREEASQWLWDNVSEFRTNPHLYRVVQVPEAD